MVVHSQPELIEFDPHDPDPLATRMRELAAQRDGWVNLLPVADEETDTDAPPARAGVFNWISSRGPEVPVCSWVPGARKRKGAEPDSLGIQHGAGPRAVARLTQNGVPLPSGWRVLSDHPKRGLVLELPEGADPAEVLDWLLRATTVLATTPLPARWVAVVHRR